jgi:hypothetical protein
MFTRHATQAIREKFNALQEEGERSHKKLLEIQSTYEINNLQIQINSFKSKLLKTLLSLNGDPQKREKKLLAFITRFLPREQFPELIEAPLCRTHTAADGSQRILIHEENLARLINAAAEQQRIDLENGFKRYLYERFPKNLSSLTILKKQQVLFSKIRRSLSTAVSTLTDIARSANSFNIAEAKLATDERIRFLDSNQANIENDLVEIGEEGYRIANEAQQADSEAQQKLHQAKSSLHAYCEKNKPMEISVCLAIGSVGPGKKSRKKQVNEELYGMLPLHIACQCGHVELAKNLIRYGANPNKRDAFGLRAVDYAKQAGIDGLVFPEKRPSYFIARSPNLDISESQFLQSQLRDIHLAFGDDLNAISSRIKIIKASLAMKNFELALLELRKKANKIRMKILHNLTDLDEEDTVEKVEHSLLLSCKLHDIEEWPGGAAMAVTSPFVEIAVDASTGEKTAQISEETLNKLYNQHLLVAERKALKKEEQKLAERNELEPAERQTEFNHRKQALHETFERFRDTASHASDASKRKALINQIELVDRQRWVIEDQAEQSAVELKLVLSTLETEQLRIQEKKQKVIRKTERSLHCYCEIGDEQHVLKAFKGLSSSAKRQLANKKVNGYYPLHLACRKRQINIVRYLLKKGANKNLRDRFGRTAIDYARESGIKELVFPEQVPTCFNPLTFLYNAFCSWMSGDKSTSQKTPAIVARPRCSSLAGNTAAFMSNSTAGAAAGATRKRANSMDMHLGSHGLATR